MSRIINPPRQYPTLSKGQTNIAVRSLQAGLRRGLSDLKLPSQNRANGSYGTGTVADTNRFKHAAGIRPVVGVTWGGDGEWRELLPYLGAYDKGRIAKFNALLEDAREAEAKAAAEKLAISSIRAAIALQAIRFWTTCRATYVYGQYRPMPPGLYVPDARTRLDCSASATDIFKEAGAPDPNGRGYDGYGWTGTLWARGVRTTVCRPGTLAFYGWDSSRGAPKHVAVPINGFEVVSFGHTPIEKYPLLYRSDFLGLRDYGADWGDA